MKYRLDELKQIMKDNGMKRKSTMLKQEVIDLLREKKLLPEVETELIPPKCSDQNTSI